MLHYSALAVYKINLSSYIAKLQVNFVLSKHTFVELSEGNLLAKIFWQTDDGGEISWDEVRLSVPSYNASSWLLVGLAPLPPFILCTQFETELPTMCTYTVQKCRCACTQFVHVPSSRLLTCPNACMYRLGGVVSPWYLHAHIGILYKLWFARI